LHHGITLRLNGLVEPWVREELATRRNLLRPVFNS
jgi:hypothetical protein